MVKQKIKKSQSFVKYILFLTLCKEDTTNVNTYFSVFSTSYILCGQNIILLKAQKVKENGKFWIKTNSFNNFMISEAKTLTEPDFGCSWMWNLCTF